MSGVPYTFANASNSIPLSELDANFAYLSSSVTDASSISYEQGNTLTAGSFVVGKTYQIKTLGNTDFTTIGATSNTVGTNFVATGAGSGTGTAYYSETVQTKLRQTVSPIDFGAVGDGTTDDTTALTSCFSYASSNNMVVDGGGLSYKVTPSVIIDPYATSGVGYGANKAWFCITSFCKNIGIIGDTSFGDTFIGKWQYFDSVTITGDCRVSSWYCNYRCLNVSGTTWFGGDVPPTSNFFGFYYNTFDSCIFADVICDQRYGPVNLNNWRECRFSNWWVKNTGYVGWTTGDYPTKSFHMNQFLNCEVYTATGGGITAPDGNIYSMVIGDSSGNGVQSGGVNRIIGLYNESSVRGLYGDSWVIDNIHLSGNSANFGGGNIAFTNNLTGEIEGAGEQRTIPFISTDGNVITGGDWSVLNNAGYPYCLSLSNASASIVTDSTEPTGLGKCVEVTTSIAFGVAYINNSVVLNANSKVLMSFAFIYQIVSGSIDIVTEQPDGTYLYGSTSQTYLNNSWILVYGKTYGSVQITSGSAFSIKISAISMARGNGVVSPCTNVSKPNIGYGTSAPTTATWGVGDIIYNTAPTSGGYVGFVCVSAGTPGTWKTFGAIS